jgi:hypothetical protein
MIYLGHHNSYPYGVLPRPTSGFASSTSLRVPSDTSTGNSSQNPLSNDPYAAFAFSQDPMLGMKIS